MGDRYSSATRVVPVLCELAARDPSGRTWLQELLALPERPGGAVAPLPQSIGDIRDRCWGNAEKQLAPL